MLKVNLGCGPFPLTGWINYDKDDWKPLNDYIGEISHINLLDFDSYSLKGADRIYIGHVLTQLEYADTKKLLRKCCAEMNSGGLIRICEFDIKWFLNYYLGSLANGIYFKLTAKEKRDLKSEYRTFHSILEQFWFDLHRYNRKSVYDYTTLQEFLMEAGFINIYSFKTSVSNDVEFQSIEPRTKVKQFCVEATKV